MGFNSGFKGLSVNKYCHTVRVEPGRASEIHTVLSAFSAGFHNFTFFFSFAKQNVTTRGPFVLVNLTGFFFFLQGSPFFKHYVSQGHVLFLKAVDY